MTVALIGPMGAGKSSVGRRVARELALPFTDTDSVIVLAHGSIPELFDRLGEPGFRAIERDVVRAALDDGGVVALGGGAVLDPRTREQLAGCTVVLLTVTADAVEARLARGARPLLTDGLDSWRRILAERQGVYDALADIRVDTSRSPMTTIAGELAARLAEPAGRTLR